MTKNVFAFPELVLCLDCGFAEFVLSEDEVQSVREICREIATNKTLGHDKRSA